MSKNLFSVTLSQARVTPSAVVYNEIDDDGAKVAQDVGFLNTMYVRKVGMGGATPQRIRVTVESLD